MIGAALVSACLLAASPASDGHEHEHEHEGTHDSAGAAPGHLHAFEIGLAPGLVYVPSESEFAPGLHLHFVWNAKPRWGFGAGAERIFDSHGHTTVSAVVQFRIFDPWSVIVAPGVTFPDDDPAGLKPSVHLETTYEFALGEHVHLGPSLELAIDPLATHITLGMHVGVGF